MLPNKRASGETVHGTRFTELTFPLNITDGVLALGALHLTIQLQHSVRKVEIHSTGGTDGGDSGDLIVFTSDLVNNNAIAALRAKTEAGAIILFESEFTGFYQWDVPQVLGGRYNVAMNAYPAGADSGPGHVLLQFRFFE